MIASQVVITPRVTVESTLRYENKSFVYFNLTKTNVTEHATSKLLLSMNNHRGVYKIKIYVVNLFLAKDGRFWGLQ